jgi:hypothetical protein
MVGVLRKNGVVERVTVLPKVADPSAAKVNAKFPPGVALDVKSFVLFV